MSNDIKDMRLKHTDHVPTRRVSVDSLPMRLERGDDMISPFLCFKL